MIKSFLKFFPPFPPVSYKHEEGHLPGSHESLNLSLLRGKVQGESVAPRAPSSGISSSTAGCLGERVEHLSVCATMKASSAAAKRAAMQPEGESLAASSLPTMGVGPAGLGKRRSSAPSKTDGAATRPRRTKESPRASRSRIGKDGPDGDAAETHQGISSLAHAPQAAGPTALPAKSRGVDLFCYEEMDSSFVGFKSRSSQSTSQPSSQAHGASSFGAAYSAGTTVPKGKKGLS